MDLELSASWKLSKIGISLNLKIFGNFWDILSTQLQEIYHTEIFGYFITKFLHIVPLMCNNNLCNPTEKKYNLMCSSTHLSLEVTLIKRILCLVTEILLNI